MSPVFSQSSASSIKMLREYKNLKVAEGGFQCMNVIMLLISSHIRNPGKVSMTPRIDVDSVMLRS